MLSNLCILPQLNNNTALFPPDLQAHPSLDLSVTASGLVIACLHLHSIIKYIWKAMIPKFMFLAPDFSVSARPILKYLLVSSLGCKVGESTWTLWISLALTPPKKSPKPENKTKILQGFASLLKPEAQVYFSFFCLAHLPYPCSSPLLLYTESVLFSLLGWAWLFPWGGGTDRRTDEDDNFCIICIALCLLLFAWLLREVSVRPNPAEDLLVTLSLLFSTQNLLLRVFCLFIYLCSLKI